jgi:transcription initiation factor TFIIIB Brf1 subunit/transcription initiation factor TFIIB
MYYCRVCHSQNFSALDNGEQICGVCGTQSQDYIADVVEWEPNLSTRVTIKKTRPKEARGTSSTAPAISPNEAFQRVLKLQVEALILQFHCSPLLYSVVGKLWIDFLSKSRLENKDKSSLNNESSLPSIDNCQQIDSAHTDGLHNASSFTFDTSNALANESTHNENDETNKNQPEENDFEMGSVEDPNNDDDDDDDDTDNDRHVSDSEVVTLRHRDRNDDNIEKTLHYSTDGDDLISDADDNPSDVVSVKSRKMEDDCRFTHSGVPKLSLSLCFLYLACLWLREPILLRDFIVWAREERLPYVSAVKTLPPSVRNILLYRPFRFPTSRSLLKTTKKLSDFLDFVPPPHDPFTIFIRFYKDLSLPMELLPCTLRLWERNKPTLSLHSRIPMHAMLMAYVVITLKLCYGFDDKYRTKLADKHNFYKNLSIRTLQQWLEHRIKLVSETPFHNPHSLREWKSLSRHELQSYLEFCKKQIFSDDEDKMPSVLRELKDLLESAIRRATAVNELPITSSRDISVTQQSQQPPALTDAANAMAVRADNVQETSPAPKKRKVTLSEKGHYAGPASQYVIYKSDKLGEFHKSYAFLLHICASYVHTTIKVLQKAVRTAENEFLKQI